METQPAVAGVDGVRSRWVAAVLEGHEVRWHADLTAARVVTLLDHVDVVAVDVPIGLSGGPARAADLEARALLGAGRSSVFITPPVQAFRAALSDAGPVASLHAHRRAADAASRALGGQGIATQSWGLADKIVAVERAVLAAGPGAADRIVEVHPECSFAVLADTLGRARAGLGKRSAVGASRRARLLETALDLDVLACLDDPALSTVPVDDALDALVAAWSARRWATRTPGATEPLVLGDEHGHCATDGSARLPARIVA